MAISYFRQPLFYAIRHYSFADIDIQLFEAITPLPLFRHITPLITLAH
jgi:hypothetical protein